MINDEPLQCDNGKSEGEITHSQASDVLHADIAAALAIPTIFLGIAMYGDQNDDSKFSAGGESAYIVVVLMLLLPYLLAYPLRTLFKAGDNPKPAPAIAMGNVALDEGSQSAPSGPAV